MVNIYDTHAHLNFKSFDKDRDEVIKRSLDNNVWLINASSTFDTSKLAVEIAEKYKEGVYASVGLHPIHVKDEEFDAARYRDLAKSKKVVAIGETGLDYMYPEQEKQKQVFLAHLDLAQELDLPVILHCRKAHNDLLLHLTNIATARKFKLSGVVHCFTGSWSQAKQYLEMGLYLGFNGIIFKMDLDETIKKAPLDRILLETDCPYLLPPSIYWSSTPIDALIVEGRNEPMAVKCIAQRIAELRSEPYEEIAKTATENAKKLFNLT